MCAEEGRPEQDLARQEYFVQPGYVCLPASPVRLCAVISSGVVVTIYDRKAGRGGMTHFCRPYRGGAASTPKFAAPAIVGLVRLFLESGAAKEDLEAHLYGGADNPEASGYVPGIANDNVKVAKEVLSKLGVELAGGDVGGARGRKVVFSPATGETVIAKVDRLRASDWYTG